MSTPPTAPASLPLDLAMAPFPEGFSGDMDETFQQAYQNTTATVRGNFLTGLILPPGSTLPTSNVGPVAMGSTWYFWDTTTSQYLPQAVIQKAAKNFCRNGAYLVSQQAPSGGFNAVALPSGFYQHWDMAQAHCTQASVLSITQVTGPPAGMDNDAILWAINYKVGTTPTLGSGDIFAHEHLIEGSDLQMIQGQVTSLSFSCLATLAGTYSIYITNNGRDQSYVANFTISAAQAGQWVRVKIAGIPAFPTAGTWNYAEGVTGLYLGVVMALGATYKTALTGAWQANFFAGTNANTNMVAGVTNQMTLTGFKFEAAAAPTFFQCPAFQTEFEEMQRYYYTNFVYQSLTTGVYLQGVASATNTGGFNWPFPRRMCKPPSVTFYNMSTPATANSVYDMSTGASIAGITPVTGLPNVSQKGLSYSNSAMSGVAKADVIAAFIKADARLT